MFFFFAKIGIFCKSIWRNISQRCSRVYTTIFGIFCKSISRNISQRCSSVYSFGGRIKLIICQIKHELSVIIHEISTSWKNNVRLRTQYLTIWCLIYLAAVTGKWLERRDYKTFYTIYFGNWELIKNNFLEPKLNNWQ